MLNRDKLKEIVLYICRTCRNPDELGSVKLHKVLWFSETTHFRQTTNPITGVTFIKHEHGPYADVLPSIIKELQTEGRLYVRRVPFHGLEKDEYTAKAGPNLSFFNEKELRVINNSIESVCRDHTASSISERTHKDIWDMVEMFEPIPIQTTLVAKLAPITDEDMAWARNEIKNLAL